MRSAAAQCLRSVVLSWAHGSAPSFNRTATGDVEALANPNVKSHRPLVVFGFASRIVILNALPARCSQAPTEVVTE